MNTMRLHIDDIEKYVPDVALRTLILTGEATLVNALRPLPGGRFGEWAWRAPFLSGVFYAAVAPDDEQHDWIQKEWESLANARILFVGDDEIWSAIKAHYDEYDDAEYFKYFVELFREAPKDASMCFLSINFPAPHSQYHPTA